MATYDTLCMLRMATVDVPPQPGIRKTKVEDNVYVAYIFLVNLKAREMSEEGTEVSRNVSEPSVECL